MCGRYTHMYSWEELHEILSIFGTPFPIAKRYNVAPTQRAPIVRVKEGKKECALFRWGLIPSWAKDPKIGNSLINARGETVREKPSFRAAFKSKRCLIPISGFYEWSRRGEPEIKKPFYFTSSDSKPLILAGLFEGWKDPEGELLETFTIITTQANDLVSAYHERMPVILTAESYEVWLSPDSSGDELVKLLKPYPPDGMKHYEVSRAVNSPKNDSPECIKPMQQ